MRRLLCAIGLGLVAGASTGQTLQTALPSNARLVVDLAGGSDSLALPTGPTTRTGTETVNALGQVHHTVWQIASEALTPGQAMLPLRETLLAQNFDVLLDCAADTCGGFAFRFHTPTLAPPDMFVDLGNFRYLTARRVGPDGADWTALMVSRSDAFVFVQATTVRAGARAALPGAPAPVRPVPGGAPDFLARLETEGRAVLPGVTFAPGADQLSDAGAPTLAALAGFLREAPDARVLVVGHTDALGSLAGNIDLSRRRAEAVRAWLVNRHDADPARIGAEGVGYLAPLALNATAEGRERNRRVEVILDGTP